MNTSCPPALEPVSLAAPAARAPSHTFSRPTPWPSGESWLAVADEALRATHVAHCGAMTLKDRPRYRDVARFLSRRAEMLTQLIDSLRLESRCEDHLRHMNEQELLAALSESEERLSTKVRALLATSGHKLQLVKLLEQECILGQASKTRIKLALLDEHVEENHPPPRGLAPDGTAVAGGAQQLPHRI